MRRRCRGGSVSLSLEPARCVAVLAPHMDDEVIGCAGMMQRYILQGTRVIIVYLTDGAHGLEGEERERRNRQRIEESEQATTLLGIQERFYLQQPDGAFSADATVLVQLASILDREQPEVVYLPYPWDPHYDHRQTFALMQDILVQQKVDVSAFFYQIRVPIPTRLISTIMDVSSSAALKKQALGCFESQGHIDFDLSLHLQRCQGYLLGWKPRLVEVFARLDSDAWKWSVTDMAGTGRQILRHRHVLQFLIEDHKDVFKNLSDAVVCSLL